MSKTDVTFSYRARVRGAVLLLAGGGVVWLGGLVQAATNRVGIDLGGISINAATATALFTAISIGGLFAMLIGGLLLRSAIAGARELRLDTAAVSIPDLLTRSDAIRLDYADILDIRIRSVAGRRVLDIHHIGRTVQVPEGHLANRASFDDLCRILAHNVAVARYTPPLLLTGPTYEPGLMPA